MSFYTSESAYGERSTWHGMAFVVESLVLLVFIIIAVTVLVRVFVGSSSYSQEAMRLSQAAVLASNEAEYFEAHPDEEDGTSVYVLQNDVAVPVTGTEDELASATAGKDTLEVTHQVTSEDRAAGTMYTLQVAVTSEGETVYQISSQRYVSSGGVE